MMEMAAETFFLPYQRAWIEDSSRIKLMEKSRQIGMSWTAAYELVRAHAVSGKKFDSWVSSRDELQARLFVQDCKKFASILDIAAEDVSGAGVSAGDDAKSVEFANGTRIWSLSSNPDAQAGKRGTRVLDEFALHPDPYRLYSVAYPGITWGGKLRIISTHRGSENFFNKLVQEARHGGNPKGISLHRVTLQDALEQGLLSKLKKAAPQESEILDMDESEYFDYVRRSCADEESFLQEYMCEPSDDKSAFISHENLSRCLYKDGENWREFYSKENPLYLGVDVGRTSDLTVFWLLEKCGDILYTREVRVLENTPFSEQEAELHSFLRMGNLRKVAVDQSGLGRQFAERASLRYGKSRVEGLSFTSALKEKLAYALRSKFEDGALRIPDEIDIRADIRSVRRQASANGLQKFTAPRGRDGHADRFWALALAVYCAPDSFARGKINLLPIDKKEYMW